MMKYLSYKHVKKKKALEYICFVRSNVSHAYMHTQWKNKASTLLYFYFYFYLKKNTLQLMVH